MTKMPPSREEVLTPAEVAAMFGVDAKTVTRWAISGKISSIRTLGGHRRYLKSEMLMVMAQLVEVPMPDPRPATSFPPETPEAGADPAPHPESLGEPLAIVATPEALAAPASSHPAIVSAAEHAVDELRQHAERAAETTRLVRKFAAAAGAEAVAAAAAEAASVPRARADEPPEEDARAARAPGALLPRSREHTAAVTAMRLTWTVEAAAFAASEAAQLAAESGDAAAAAAAADVASSVEAAAAAFEAEVAEAAAALRAIAGAAAELAPAKTESARWPSSLSARGAAPRQR
jgi:excisionase family DNA binding protein